jgi:hypothetical protein
MSPITTDEEKEDTPAPGPDKGNNDDADKDDVLPPFPSKDSNATAFDYFNQSYFFRDERDREFFASAFGYRTKEKQKVLTATLDEFFQNVWDTHKDDVRGQTTFLLDNLCLVKYEAVMEAYNVWKETNDIGDDYLEVANLRRLVNVDFRIKDSKLSHTYDLECFSNRLDHVFDCQERETKTYLAPYFCFVQSSGMGKTKLMYEYNRMSLQEKNVASFVIIPRVWTEEDENKVKDEDKVLYTLSLAGSDKPANKATSKDASRIDARQLAVAIFYRLDSELSKLVQKAKKDYPGKDFQKVALLFDESDYLFKEEFGYDAYRFRCVRHWLREAPERRSDRDGLTIAAVFAGTNSKATNPFFDNDYDLVGYIPSSRELPLRRREYFSTGSKLHRPFSQTTTTGSCHDLLQSLSGLNEYERAVYHGRPLFAHMAYNSTLEKSIPYILLRMLRRVRWTRDNHSGWINLLSTRVQLGQLPADMTSDVVANAYANLCSYNDHTGSIRLGYLPDPVPARLAMMMMDESQKFVKVLGYTSLVGKDKRWWSEKLAEILSSGLIRSDKGDFEDVVAALYMLFCGDVLRRRINERNESTGIQPYSQFSVSLDAWLELMRLGGLLSREPTNADEDCKVSVGFIQVCRNPLRSYSDSWKSLSDQSFLKQMFETGIAFYTYNGCPLIDIVVPMRIKSDEVGNIDGCCYAPLLVSIKCQSDFKQRDAKAACEAMKGKAMMDGLERALCLLIVFGSEEEARAFKGDIAISKKATKVSDLLLTGVVAKAIRVPTEDVFGLNVVFDARVSHSQIEAELFASHGCLKAHGPDTAMN